MHTPGTAMLAIVLLSLVSVSHGYVTYESTMFHLSSFNSGSLSGVGYLLLEIEERVANPIYRKDMKNYNAVMMPVHDTWIPMFRGVSSDDVFCFDLYGIFKHFNFDKECMRKNGYKGYDHISWFKKQLYCAVRRVFRTQCRPKPGTSGNYTCNFPLLTTIDNRTDVNYIRPACFKENFWPPLTIWSETGTVHWSNITYKLRHKKIQMIDDTVIYNSLSMTVTLHADETKKPAEEQQQQGALTDTNTDFGYFLLWLHFLALVGASLMSGGSNGRLVVCALQMYWNISNNSWYYYIHSLVLMVLTGILMAISILESLLLSTSILPNLACGPLPKWVTWLFLLPTGDLESPKSYGLQQALPIVDRVVTLVIVVVGLVTMHVDLW